ncbi:hypothetical protein [uncultured Duncaniella sp.]|uniref:hypothetical protein n=2 Tax=uncultured Duncaniella sp. TaxID=2768039 RepID=UPI0026473DDA|nr:hypothetical protein [uncultured Duncaniella sp.]
MSSYLCHAHSMVHAVISRRYGSDRGTPARASQRQVLPHGIGSSPGAMARTGTCRRGCRCARRILWGGHDVLPSSSMGDATMPDTL